VGTLWVPVGTHRSPEGTRRDPACPLSALDSFQSICPLLIIQKAMAYNVDPEHVYVNLSASAGAQTTLYSTDPVAFFREKRNAPLIGDCSKYRLAVARADLQGCRTLPLFIPTINPTTDDPYLTTYKFSLSMNVSSQGTKVYPTGTFAFSFWMRVQNAVTGTLTQPGFPIAGSGTFTDLTSWAAVLQTAVRASGAGAGVPSVANAVVEGTEDGFLQITLDGSSEQAFIAASAADLAANPQIFNALGFPQSYVASTWIPFAPPDVILLKGSHYLSTNWPFLAIESSGTTYTASAITQWIPQVFGSPTPFSPKASGGQTDAIAYWTFDYNWVVALFNKTIRTAWDALQAQVPSPFVSACPVLVFNASTKTFTIYADSYGVSGRDTPSGSLTTANYSENLSITFNEFVSNLLMLPATFDLFGNATLNFSQSPLVTSSIGDVPPVPASNAWVALSSNWSPTASLWSPIGSIVFTTRVIPVASENVSSPSVYGAEGDVGNGAPLGTSSSSALMLSDVVPVAGDSSDFRSSSIVYSPTVLRWIDMPAGGFRLDEIDFELGWRNNRTGVVTPIRLNPMASFSAKLLFRRKDIID